MTPVYGGQGQEVRGAKFEKRVRKKASLGSVWGEPGVCVVDCVESLMRKGVWRT